VVKFGKDPIYRTKVIIWKYGVLSKLFSHRDELALMAREIIQKDDLLSPEVVKQS
jgi:hypothetical protein